VWIFISLFKGLFPGIASILYFTRLCVKFYELDCTLTSQLVIEKMYEMGCPYIYIEETTPKKRTIRNYSEPKFSFSRVSVKQHYSLSPRPHESFLDANLILKLCQHQSSPPCTFDKEQQLSGDSRKVSPHSCRRLSRMKGRSLVQTSSPVKTLLCLQVVSQVDDPVNFCLSQLIQQGR
jgi:hypothetical protein